MDLPPEKDFKLYQEMLKDVVASQVPYASLNENTTIYIRHTASTIVYMSICLACSAWQLLTAIEMVYRVRKWLQFAVLCQTLLSFMVILCSVLNPLTNLSCEIRFWISIIFINLGGCCIQSILLYKAYICYDRAKWLILIGSIINLGYIALVIILSNLAKLPTYKDLLGNCILENLDWPALAKLGLDIASNFFLSIAFLMVIYRHYRVFGVITSYLLIKQFSYKQKKSKDAGRPQDEEDEEQAISQVLNQSFANSRYDYHQNSSNTCPMDTISSKAKHNSRFSSGILSASTTIKASDDIQPKIVL
ncbi:hypothetical protein BD560DRAFT_493386 [Blakeslea trispora]|nr:hypothetical protein BD560DRAFT_493386 [Blakeslea trispora]